MSSDHSACGDKFVYYDETSRPDCNDECENWDSDCKVVTVKYEGKRFVGRYTRSPIEIDQPPPSKMVKSSIEINREFSDELFINRFKENWDSNESLICKKAELIIDPFKACVLKDFIHDSSFLSNLRDEFNYVEWHKRSMDLYEFFQSSDLKHLDNFECIHQLYKFLENTVMDWISKLTGLNLVKVSATCSLYGDTDFLLVHDDQQDDRMVAFILYLSGSNWTENYGGSLQLLGKDENKHPSHVIRDILPSSNQFVFFQVSNDSYHQVAEVTCKNDCRMSINGWFHTEIPPTFETPLYVPPTCGIFSDNYNEPQETDIDLCDWVSNAYLENDVAQEIQRHIEENSEVSLRKFFRDVVVQTLLEELNLNGLNWTRMGPPNRHCYDRLEEKDIPQTLERLFLLFQSKEIFQLLKAYTDLDLKCLKYEMQKWTPGCYTLLSDYDWTERGELDLILYLGCSNPHGIIGGKTIYISTEEEVQQAFMTIEPLENSLNIVFRDTARFTKYFSRESSCKCFYVLVCSYSE